MLLELDVDDPETIRHINHYLRRLGLPGERLRLTTDRARFAAWLGRRVEAAIGGAYVYLGRVDQHLILINLARLDRTRPRSVEVVVAEELLHMRDRLDGDLRRHAKHGYDRIARRVAVLTGASPEEIRSALLPVRRRPLRYVYQCPDCGRQVGRRQRGTWSCGACSPTFDPRFRLRLVRDRGPTGGRDTAA